MTEINRIVFKEQKNSIDRIVEKITGRDHIRVITDAVGQNRDRVAHWTELFPWATVYQTLPNSEQTDLLYISSEQVRVMADKIERERPTVVLHMQMPEVDCAVECLTQCGYCWTSAEGRELLFVHPEKEPATELSVGQVACMLAEYAAQAEMTDKKHEDETITTMEQCYSEIEASRAAITAALEAIVKLREENRQYRYKIGKITNTWYGKITLKCYRFLRKCKYLFTTGKWA